MYRLVIPAAGWAVSMALAAALVAAPAADGASDDRPGAFVQVATNASKAVSERAQELAGWLGKITGETVMVATGAAPAEASVIMLARADSPTVPASWRRRVESRPSLETYLLRSEGARRVWVIGRTDRAIEHGVYDYLHRLGCRWFLPNDHWTLIPHRADILLKLDALESPAFRERSFFGTGGFGGDLPLDPGRKLQARWEQWARRNRLGGDIHLSGHAGEAFNLRHKAELLAHPEYLAEINGARQPWTPETKPCCSNPGLQALYVKDRLDELRRQIAADPDGVDAQSVSVEPSDGDGHCDCAACRKMGPVSDRVYTLVNRVADAVDKEFPGRYVNLYAYNQHAAVPTIPVAKNVLVSIVPYGFQRTGLTGDEQIEAWGAKHRSLGLYDYWGVTDWTDCQPHDHNIHTAARQIRFFHDHGMLTFTGESSYSGGSDGLLWYLSARLLWDPGADEKAVLEDFYEKAFGRARAPLQRMIERWAAGFMLSRHEIGASFRDLEEAYRLADEPALRARIDDLARYVQYLRLYEEFKRAPVHSALQKERADALLVYIWRIYDSAMMHTYRMHRLLTARYLPQFPELTAKWDETEGAYKGTPGQFAAVWKTIAPLRDDDIPALLADGRRTCQPLDYEPRSFSADLVPWRGGAPLETNLVETPLYAETTDFEFHVVRAPAEIRFRIRCYQKPTPGYPGDRAIVRGPDGKVLLECRVPGDEQWRDLTVRAAKPGRYRLQVVDQKSFFSLQVPAGLPFVSVGAFTSCSLAPPQYFLVPKGTAQLVMYLPVEPSDLVYTKIFDADGREVAFDKDARLFALAVPPGQDGRPWSIQGIKTFFTPRLLNAPGNFALSPETLLVPKELKAGR